MKNEIWKDIPGYESFYQVSNLGNVKALARTVVHKTGRTYHFSEKLRKPYMDNLGYEHIALFKNGYEKRFYVHRLVAMAFLSNPNNLPCVNHMDQNPSNNNVENLEWCTAKYNINYKDCIEKRSKAKSKPVLQYTKENVLLREWESAKAASLSLKIHDGDIAKCCKHLPRYKTCGGFKWEYKP